MTTLETKQAVMVCLYLTSAKIACTIPKMPLYGLLLWIVKISWQLGFGLILTNSYAHLIASLALMAYASRLVNKEGIAHFPMCSRRLLCQA